MMKKNLILMMCIALSNIMCAQTIKKKLTNTKPLLTPASAVKTVPIPAEGIFATIETTKGNIVLLLEYKKTPITVANFVSLAEGTNTAVKAALNGKPFYDGLKWHRVIKDFMIQGGDPLGNGSGDPGYKFKDEFTDLVHDKAGILSMANSGPGTNGSQFFITHKDTPWLNGKHTIFGHVVSGQNVVNAIVQDDLIKSVKILRKGAQAKTFDAAAIFTKYFTNKDADLAIENAKKNAALQLAKDTYRAQYGTIMDTKVKELTIIKTLSTKTATGLEHFITKGTGSIPAADSTVFIHYAGYLEDGTMFDSSYEAVNRLYGKFDQNRANANGYAPFPFKVGTKTGMIPGFIETLGMMSLNDKATVFIPSKIGYGERGAGEIIPPNTNLIFEVEMLETMPAAANPSK